jgi:hypothetical protein
MAAAGVLFWAKRAKPAALLVMLRLVLLAHALLPAAIRWVGAAGAADAAVGTAGLADRFNRPQQSMSKADPAGKAKIQAVGSTESSIGGCNRPRQASLLQL